VARLGSCLSCSGCRDFCQNHRLGVLVSVTKSAQVMTMTRVLVQRQRINHSLLTPSSLEAVLLVLVRSVCPDQVRRVLSTQLLDACRSSKSVPVPHSFDSRHEEDWIAAHEGLDHQRSESPPLSLLTLFSPSSLFHPVDSLEDRLPRLECEEPDNEPRLLRSLVSKIV
jgi:hypothetical protein